MARQHADFPPDLAAYRDDFFARTRLLVAVAYVGLAVVVAVCGVQLVNGVSGSRIVQVCAAVTVVCAIVGVAVAASRVALAHDEVFTWTQPFVLLIGSVIGVGAVWIGNSSPLLQPAVGLGLGIAGIAVFATTRRRLGRDPELMARARASGALDKTFKGLLMESLPIPSRRKRG